MDLKEYEFRSNKKLRHPWEIARIKSLIKILEMNVDLSISMRILDVGCGDAYVGQILSKALRITEYHAIDINLSETQIKQFSSMSKQISFYNDYSNLPGGTYDLVLLLDVIEHLEKDHDFLKWIVGTFIQIGKHILITVPVFQFLFSSHDNMLGHFRRYSLQGLTDFLKRSNLCIAQSGYLFSLLLPLRMMSHALQQVIPVSPKKFRGVGEWTGGPFTTKFISSILYASNSVTLSINDYGIKIPGLTGWVLCQRLL